MEGKSNQAQDHCQVVSTPSTNRQPTEKDSAVDPKACASSTWFGARPSGPSPCPEAVRTSSTSEVVSGFPSFAFFAMLATFAA